MGDIRPAARLLHKIDSYLTGRLFTAFMVYSYSKNYFAQKHWHLDRLPLAPHLFAFSVGLAVFSLVLLLSGLEPAYSIAKGFLNWLFSRRFTFQVTLKPHHFAAALPVLFVLVWAVL